MNNIQSQIAFHKNNRAIVATSETQLTEGETNRLEHSDQDGVIVIVFSLNAHRNIVNTTNNLHFNVENRAYIKIKIVNKLIL